MCGIVAASAKRNVMPILLEGLHRLEYRGYDSAGMAVHHDESDEIRRVRVKGKVASLAEALNDHDMSGHAGIAHTRWATHGPPTVKNAHPHMSGTEYAVVHNGIIENHEELRGELSTTYKFLTDTDTETIAHLIHREVTATGSYIHGIRKAISYLRGAYALVILSLREPGRLVAVRSGCPLILGLGVGENFFTSDTSALLPVTQRFVILEEGDIVDIDSDRYKVFDAQGQEVNRHIHETQATSDLVDKGNYKHFMLKEIHEQPQAVRNTLSGRLDEDQLFAADFGDSLTQVLNQIDNVHIVACGTSYFAGMVAKHWIERYGRRPCQVEIASEFRYRDVRVPEQTLYLTISQSGETADALAALETAKQRGYLSSLAICNVQESTMARRADHCVFTKAGPEIGVASTKAFTTQLTMLLLLAIILGQSRGMSKAEEGRLVAALCSAADILELALKIEPDIRKLAAEFVDKQHALFLGRGPFFPIALEGALKLKEISYIHAEGYPAGELKHGPLALVDAGMPVVAIAPNDQLLDKLKSNLAEVRARGGLLYLFAEETVDVQADQETRVISMPRCPDVIAPLMFTLPLQLLAYYVASLRGTDVDQPRNLAKSVTVE